jgi:methyl-accepting chemotaxis protein
MFEPEMEARFRRIEDAQVVAADLLHRFENETRENVRHMSAVINAIAQWMDRCEQRLPQLETRQDEFDAKLNAVIHIIEDLSREIRETMRIAREATRTAQEATRAAVEARSVAQEAAETARSAAASVDRLSQIVERYLKARTNGGVN